MTTQLLALLLLLVFVTAIVRGVPPTSRAAVLSRVAVVLPGIAAVLTALVR